MLVFSFRGVFKQKQQGLPLISTENRQKRRTMIGTRRESKGMDVYKIEGGVLTRKDAFWKQLG